ncbi:MAG: hypothetical protein ACE5KE_15980 [Methanosarcinales archaeon]
MGVNTLEYYGRVIDNKYVSLPEEVVKNLHLEPDSIVKIVISKEDDVENIILSKSPTFKRIIDKAFKEIEDGKYRSAEELLDEIL